MNAIENFDLYSSAFGLIHRHRRDAVTFALRRAGDMLAAGDVRRFWEWIEVMTLVHDLLQDEPAAELTIH